MTRTLCTLNLNGIRSAEKRGFSKWLKKNKPDVLCVQELRAGHGDVEEHLYSPQGYSARWSSAVKKGYAGVGLYTRHAPDRYVVGTTFDHCRDEGRVLRADFDDISVISLYVPSGSSSAERQRIKFGYLDCLLPWMEELLKEDRPIAVCGDINIAHTPIDLARPKQNVKNSGFLPEEREWFSKMLALGWIDTVRAHNPDKAGMYSFWSNRGAAREKDIGWRLDYVLTSPAMHARTKRAWIEPKAKLSDHAPVWVEFG